MMTAFRQLLWIVLSIYSLGSSVHSCLEWTDVKFRFPCLSSKFQTEQIPNNAVVASRAQICNNDLIVAFPRCRPGIPATLAKTSLINFGFCTTFDPFPCWPTTIQEVGNCNAFQSVVDIVLDQYDILWVLDNGCVEEWLSKCPPKIVALNVRTGIVLKTIWLDHLANCSSVFQFLVVEYSKDDGRCFLYLSDAGNKSIIVYDVQASCGYRVLLLQNTSFGCYSRIQSGETPDELYITLLKKACGTSFLYFSYTGSTHLFSVKTSCLRSGLLAGQIKDVGRKPRKLMFIGTDQKSSMFIRYDSREVFQYNVNSCFAEKNFKLVYRSEDCFKAIQVVTDNKRNVTRVLESKILQDNGTKNTEKIHQKLAFLQLTQ